MNWKQKAGGLIILGVGLIIAAVMGLFVYMAVTATPLHPNPQAMPSVAGSARPAKWADSVERARQIVRMGAAAQNMPGVSVAVGVGGDIVWAEGFGFADLESRVPVAPNMRFRIGTASTVLTSAAVGLLLEKGRLNLDSEIQTYVPDFPEKEWPVTVRQLMGHLAGVRNDGGDEGPLFSVHCERPVEALEVFSERSLLFEPGTKFRYSSYGWILLSAAVEAAAAEPFLTFMRKQVFDPLGMRDTVPDSATEPILDRATAYFPKFSADPRYGPDPMREIDLSCYAGSSVFLSTPSDLVRFGMAINGHLRQGYGGQVGAQGGKLLQPATVQLLQTSQRLPSGEETGYGLGWDLETVTLAGEQTRLVGHDGDVLGGMVASLMTFPNGIVVAVTSNTSYADTFSLGVKIAEAFVEQGKSPAGK